MARYSALGNPDKETVSNHSRAEREARILKQGKNKNQLNGSSDLEQLGHCGLTVSQTTERTGEKQEQASENTSVGKVSAAG